MLTVNNLYVDYFGKSAIEDISLTLPFGSCIGIIGPNGAGKSTFIKSILGIVKKQSGQIHYHQKPIKEKLKFIAYVPQKSDIDISFPITVFDTILTGTYPHLPLFRRPGKKEKEKAIEVMKHLQIETLQDRQISNLSGGQLQRVFIARALAQNADCYLLDEPFAGIDLVSEQIIIAVLKELRNKGKMVVVVHHDLHAVENYFDKIIILNKRLIAYGDVKEVFNTQTIMQAYGQSLGNIEIKGMENR